MDLFIDLKLDDYGVLWNCMDDVYWCFYGFLSIDVHGWLLWMIIMDVYFALWMFMGVDGCFTGFYVNCIISECHLWCFIDMLLYVTKVYGYLWIFMDDSYWWWLFGFWLQKNNIYIYIPWGGYIHCIIWHHHKVLDVQVCMVFHNKNLESSCKITLCRYKNTPSKWYGCLRIILI